MAIATARATGQLPAAAAVLYTFTADAKVFVSLANSGATQRAFNLYLNTGTRRRFAASAVPASGCWPAGGSYGPIYGKSGDTIDGDAAAAAEIDYVIGVVNL